MSSRSSSSTGGDVVFGRIVGHRGLAGEVTVRVFVGEAAPWTGLERVVLEDGGGGRARRTVEAARAYRDRLVLKLEGVDDAGDAAALRGWRVAAPPGQRPVGLRLAADLVGFDVQDESGRSLGRVRDVQPTGGVDLLHVAPPDLAADGEDLLVPMAPEIVLEIVEQERRVLVRLPDGLAELNRRPSEASR